MSTPRSSPSLLARQWQHGGWLSTLLSPLAALTAWAVARKRAAYASGAKPSYRAPVPVVVVGNIYVGGTGKTPVVIATVQGLRARGFTPGVVSRGYGVKIGPDARVGVGALAANLYGDEPALIARATGAPVSVHPKRALAARALLHAHPEVDVIVSDDGLQHLALARDIEIVVQDARGVGNGRLLPAGPLREPAQRLRDVDVVVTNIGEPDGRPADSGSRPRPVRMWLEPGDARHIEDGATRPLSAFAGQPRIAAAAGIGNPERFFTTLRAAGIEPEATLPLPDHHDYAESPFQSLSADTILVTSKDAIKCAALHDRRLWEVPVQAAFSDPQLFDWLAQALRLRAPT
ncbi:tetraacyldisaccharide 4'-kinase [Achromobacter piechaudii]|uniref:Tetraacyldisaccharide 4'-kinase n=1 Tax=Achromobacter piechaudii TaxID=72556 RepID=A0ABN7EYW1_9BURK|nr:tetraacyldisaccharide 4'-kinase [Achromobacter piechaudii]KNY08989.1 tetraacyldisaccharide 4'-kinase [Achromobacter piechaudii]CAB3697911.1 Tetraacyldisaccharide 4'-kinase [Achromobacter piechaudii]CAB3854708.1 Tetraacyldisaccharide 4'-kinase [Achromobacter piechaudii]CAB3950441.1 Tetraacyldisaccharide 4'-kinase [Achromobacter piechaudii]